MNPEVHKWFHAIHIDVTEIYGMTEDTGPATIGIPNHAIDYVKNMFKSGSVPIPEVLNPIGKVGIPLAGTEVKVLDDGELCIKGKHVASGYYKLEEETKEIELKLWLRGVSKEDAIIIVGHDKIGTELAQKSLKQHFVEIVWPEIRMGI